MTWEVPTSKGSSEQAFDTVRRVSTKPLVRSEDHVQWTYVPGVVNAVVGGREHAGLADDPESRLDLFLDLLERGLEVARLAERRGA
jgi:hypothetical protein